MELCKPPALLILWTYGRLRLCDIAVYIAFKLLSTWNHREKTTPVTNSLWNDKLTINFFHRHSNFDRNKFRDTWYITIRTCITLSQAKSYRHLITLKNVACLLGFCSFSSERLYKVSHCFIAVSKLRFDSTGTIIDFPNVSNKNIFKM